MPLLELKDVWTYYGKIAALKGINLSVEEGDIVAILGANGAGKSTILMTICGITPCREGEITFAQRRIDGCPPPEIVSRGISQVPEGRRIFPNLTVSENLDLGAFLRRDKGEIARDKEYVYSLFPILKERRHQQGGTLSGGEQQMLAVSRALMARPRLLLLDEPSLGLAPLVARQIFLIIKKINEEQGTTVILVEQNAYMALKIASRGYVLENGRVTLEGPSAELMKNEEVKTAYLGL